MRSKNSIHRYNVKEKESKKPQVTGRVFSFGVFIADLIYRQKQASALPEEFLGIRRLRGDNAMIVVPAAWIAQAKEALEALKVPLTTNFGGLANAMVSILAALTSKEKITLIALCGNDEPGRANIAYLERLGVDTAILRKLMHTSKVSACNLIRNLETAPAAKNKPAIYSKDFAFYLTPIEGFPYSHWIPKDLKRQDIVHIGGVDLVLCPKHWPKAHKQAKYKRNIAEMLKLARASRRKGAVVVADFCMGDSDFWEIVPDNFFRNICVAKPGISQALAIYNSRHKSNPIKLDLASPQQLAKEHLPQLLEVANFLIKLGFGAIFMTLDAGGTIICAHKNSIFGKVFARYVPIIPARKFVDGTGCGDAFVAGIIYGIRQGWKMFATACFASTIGSLIAERAGVSLEEKYIGKGKWLTVVEKRLKEYRDNLKKESFACKNNKEWLSLRYPKR
jgi:sugar/nucleoside kinase (ribokinase family)